MPAAAAVDSPANRANSLSLTFWLGQIDLRPLALFRIAFGLFIAYDLLDLLPIATTFFSDVGVMPRASLFTQMARQNRISLGDVLGAPEAVYVYWIIAFILCLLVVVGYRTRVTVVLLYLFLAGFNERLPELFDGSDSVIRLTLFWLCFASSGNRYSVDALLGRLRGTPLAKTGCALPQRVIQGQVAWVYLCSFLHKTGGLTWHLTSNTGSGLIDWNNAALHYVLHLNHVFARPWAASLADFTPFVVLGTVFTMVFESSFLFLAFSPVLNKWTKALALVMGVMLHGGIAMTVNVGLFSYLMPVTYLAFFEPEWTEWLVDRLERLCGAGTTTVLYDGKCAVCTRGRAAAEAMDRFGNLAFVDIREAKVPKAAESIKRADLEEKLHAVTPSGAVVAGPLAAMEIGRRVPGGFVAAWFAWLPLLGEVPRALWRWRSQQLHLRARQQAWSTALPEEHVAPTLLPEAWHRFASGTVYTALAAIFISAAWYAAPQPGRRYLPRPAENAVQWLSIWNIWDMFSPEPLRTDYHLSAPAEYSDGSTDDLFGGPVDGPGEIRGFWFTRWWKYLENVTQGAQVIQEEWARWQCKRHNWGDAPRENGGRMLYKFKLVRVNQVIPPIGQPWPPEQRAEIVTWRCYDKPEDRPAKPPPPNVSVRP